MGLGKNHHIAISEYALLVGFGAGGGRKRIPLPELFTPVLDGLMADAKKVLNVLRRVFHARILDVRVSLRKLTNALLCYAGQLSATVLHSPQTCGRVIAMHYSAVNTKRKG